MRKSRTQSAETRERILSNASKMFLDKGLAAVGVGDSLTTIAQPRSSWAPPSGHFMSALEI